MNTFKSYVVLSCLVLCLTCGHPISVKIVRESNGLSPNFNHDFKAKSEPSNFTGPTHLSYLVGKCFSYSSEKYDYKVCPFRNITQHEKVWHSGAYNGVIGVWKEWSVRNNSFDSLVFKDGDDCEDGVQRSAKLVWICAQNEAIDRVIDIKEPKKCFYEIHFSSDFGCDWEDKYIYPHLSQEFKSKWDQIETEYFYKELTQLGYESALRELLVESAIITNTTAVESNEISFESLEKCFNEFVLLKEMNVKLKQRIEFLENELNLKNQ